MAPTFFLHMFFSCRFDFFNSFVDILPEETNVDRNKKESFYFSSEFGWEDVWKVCLKTSCFSC